VTGYSRRSRFDFDTQIFRVNVISYHTLCTVRRFGNLLVPGVHHTYWIFPALFQKFLSDQIK
jgi:hypothetical protein